LFVEEVLMSMISLLAEIVGVGGGGGGRVARSWLMEKKKVAVRQWYEGSEKNLHQKLVLATQPRSTITTPQGGSACYEEVHKGSYYVKEEPLV